MLLTSTSVFQIGSGSGLDIQWIPAQQKALPVACNAVRPYSIHFSWTKDNILARDTTGLTKQSKRITSDWNKIQLDKKKIKYYLDFAPLIILTISAAILIWTVSTTDTALSWKHIVGLILLPLNYFLFFKNHKVGVVALGLTLLIGMVSLLSFSPRISTSTISIGKNSDFLIPVFYGQSIFLLWLIIHFVISARHYFGILTRHYWKNLYNNLKK